MQNGRIKPSERRAFGNHTRQTRNVGNTTNWERSSASIGQAGVVRRVVEQRGPLHNAGGGSADRAIQSNLKPRQTSKLPGLQAADT